MAARLKRLLAFLVVSLFLLATPTDAHDLSSSDSRLQIEGRNIRILFIIDLHELRTPGVSLNLEGPISYDQLDSQIENIYAAIKLHYQITSRQKLPSRVTVERYDLEDEHVLRMSLVETFAQDIDQLEVVSTLDQITRPDHRHLSSVNMSGEQEAILDASVTKVVFRPQPRLHLNTFRKFLLLGIEHIFTGYDHLAFLLSLLIAATSLRSLIKIISSFTIAHSVTLALATFNLVVLPSRFTESLIALSIAYVALENVLKKQAVERYVITFVFGLVHGFGFSNVLREMHLPRTGLALSLFSFNSGVEVGQLAFVFVLFPLLGYFSASRWRFLRAAVSFGTIGVGLFWFVQRAFLI